MNIEQFEDYNTKIKSNINGIFGVGYYLMDHFRAELTLDSLVNPEFKGSFFEDIKVFEFKISGKGKTKGNVKSLLLSGYVDLYDAGIVKLFVGAGVGMAQVKEKSTGTVTIEVEDEKVSGTVSESSKNANNFAYQLTAGVSLDLADRIKLDITYSWRDYGDTKPGTYNLKFKDIDVYSGTSSKTSYKGHNLIAGIRFDI